jgi:intein/homing endonuclease
MGIKNVTQIPKTDPTSIYADTDSVDCKSIIKTEKYSLSIEEWYNKNINNGSGGVTIKGHESVLTDDRILNYCPDRGIYYAPVKRIIRHKVSKTKWKLKTKSGKEIYVTNDHSMIVFRNGKKIEVKPSEIIESDKILVLKTNICKE